MFWLHRCIIFVLHIQYVSLWADSGPVSSVHMYEGTSHK